MASLADIRAARLLQSVKYMTVASITILVWDYFLTLEREISLVWKRPWCGIKVLYMLSRFPPFVDVPLVLYYSLGHNPPLTRCQPIYAITSWFTVFAIVVAEAILMKRTVALWGGDNRVYFGLIGLMVAITIAGAVMLSLFLDSLKYGVPPLSTTGCYLIKSSVIIFIDFILLIILESILLALSLWVGFKRFRHSRNHLIYVLYRDGIFYFVYTFAISLGNILVLVAGPPELVDLLNTFQRVIHSILSTRIVLHVRSADEQVKKDNLGGSSVGDTQRISSMHFAANNIPTSGATYQSTSFSRTEEPSVGPSNSKPSV